MSTRLFALDTLADSIISFTAGVQTAESCENKNNISVQRDMGKSIESINMNGNIF